MFAIRSLRNLLAEQGDAEAQLELGQMYFEATNLVTSYTWLSIATLNGSVEAEKTKRAVAKKMTPEQISKAEAQAKKMIEVDMRLIQKK